MMHYKGYIGQVEYDDTSQIYSGLVVAINAMITFYGETLKEAEQAFQDSVDDYLDWCEERGKEPEKTQLGNLSVKIEPSLHETLIAKSEQQGTDLDSYVIDLLSKAV